MTLPETMYTGLHQPGLSTTRAHGLHPLSLPEPTCTDLQGFVVKLGPQPHLVSIKVSSHTGGDEAHSGVLELKEVGGFGFLILYLTLRTSASSAVLSLG